MAIDTALVSEWLAAAEHGNLTALKRLLAKHPSLLDAQGTGPYWEGNFRAIHYAVARGHRKVVRWLLDRGASASRIRGDADWAPIHFAAIPGAERDLLRLLVRHGAEKDIFTAAALRDAKSVRQLLRRNRRLVSARGPDGATPLHFAGSVGVAKALLAAGANPNIRDRFHGQTAIEWALDKPAVVRVLANAGAGIDIHLAAAMGDLARVTAHVRQDPTSLSARLEGKQKLIGGEGETALGMAARYGHRKVVDLLLEHGADAATDPSPLPGAVHTRDLALVKRLLRAGADPNAFGPYGHAAVHIASVYGNLAMIRTLLAAGGRLDLRDKEHHSTPLEWAEYHKHKRAASFLRARQT